jgi:methyl-accepting chemotaxis protein
MNVREKLLLGAGALVLIPVALTAAFLWQGSSSLSENTISELSQSQLVSIRDSKRAQIQDEIESRVRNVQALGAQRSTLEAMRSFKTSFQTAAKDTAKFDPTVAREKMAEFVQKQFAPEYGKRNAQAFSDPGRFLAGVDPNGAALQLEFIVNNPNPLGQKEKLITPAVDSLYARVHAQYHPSFEKTLKLQEFYDFFLIDTDTDQIVYTVFKELDFGTNLNDGIAAKTKLGEAYRKAKGAVSKDAIVLTDFDVYAPSYDDQAAFVATPIFDGDKQIGVLAAQFPIDKITQVMSANKEWKKIGLGDTGDVFLVGPEKKMRTVARYLTSDREKFIASLAGKITEQERAQLIKKDTTIGLVTVDSEAVRSAASQKDAYLEFVDYRGVPSYGAVGPVAVRGLNWAIVAKIDKSEVDAPVDNLTRSFLWRALAIATGVIALAALLTSRFVRRFLRPVETLSKTVDAVQRGDTGARARLIEQDEFGALGRSFDQMLDERIQQLEKTQKENEGLNNSVITLLQTVFQLSNRDLTARAPVTEDVVGTVSSSINQFADETGRTILEVKGIADQVRELSDSVRSQAVLVNESAANDKQSLESMSKNLAAVTAQLNQVAQVTEQSNAAAANASSATDAALTAVDGTVKGMDRLRETMSEMEKRFKRLGERSQEITSAIALINTISERTHVLAVNASMQAATAGEAGRGFAVVAGEVQRLSDSSRQATNQIAQLVGNIQSDTSETLLTVNRLIGEVVDQTALARQAGTQMAQTQSTTQQLVHLVQQIVAFSRQQAVLANSLQKSVVALNQGAARTTQAISTQTHSTQTLATVAIRLSDAVGQFKVSPATP